MENQFITVRPSQLELDFAKAKAIASKAHFATIEESYIKDGVLYLCYISTLQNPYKMSTLLDMVLIPCRISHIGM